VSDAMPAGLGAAGYEFVLPISGVSAGTCDGGGTTIAVDCFGAGAVAAVAGAIGGAAVVTLMGAVADAAALVGGALIAGAASTLVTMACEASEA